MSKILHLTETKRLRSIYKNGLLQSEIKLPSHLKRFKKAGLKGNKCIYTWDANTYENGRFIKDMIYCKMFIHPRNEIFDDDWERWNKGQRVDFRKFGKKLYNFNAAYTLLEIDYDYVWEDALNRSWWHAQEPTGSPYNVMVNMDTQYAHDDKQLIIINNTISSEHIKPVETIAVRKYKNEDLGFSFNKI